MTDKKDKPPPKGGYNKKRTGAGDKNSKQKARPGPLKGYRWIAVITVWTFVISIALSAGAGKALEYVNIVWAAVILLFFILVGIIFDIIAVAVISVDEQPFHSMSAKKVDGAREAIWLIQNAEKVANICGDVVGDVCGIMSGSTIAVIVVAVSGEGSFSFVFQLILTAVAASLTIGAKAVSKTVALTKSRQIVYLAGKVLNLLCFGAGKRAGR